MDKVKIFCDSGSDLSHEMAAEYDITILPLISILNGVEYIDGVDLEPAAFYASMRNGDIYTTSQYPLDDFLKVFEEYASSGRPCLFIAFSSEISGTYSSSRIAADMMKEKYPNSRVEVYDSKCASLGCGMVVFNIAKRAAEGAGIDELLELTAWWSDHVDHIFAVDDVKYLARGGRVSKTSAFFASSLDIRPVLNVEDGKLIPIKKVRGLKKVLASMIELMRQRSIDPGEHEVWISHADAYDKVESLIEMIKNEFGTTQFVVGNIGSVIGAHAGPGTIALFFVK